MKAAGYSSVATPARAKGSTSAAANAPVSGTPFVPVTTKTSAAAAGVAAAVTARGRSRPEGGSNFVSQSSRDHGERQQQRQQQEDPQQQITEYSSKPKTAAAPAVLLFSGREEVIMGDEGGGVGEGDADMAGLTTGTLSSDDNGHFFTTAGATVVGGNASPPSTACAEGLVVQGGDEEEYARLSHEDAQHHQQQQALPLTPPLAPLHEGRFKAEAMELESALRSRDEGIHGRADEGDASGQQLASARRLRSLLSSNREELIREALDRNWVPLLMGWLGADTRPAVQVEALWALTNIAAGATDHAQVLTNSGAVPPLVLLLDSPNEEVLEQALWLLGNLAGEGATARDAVLAVDALVPLIRCLERHQGSRSLLKIGSWTLSNLCDGQPRPVLDVHTVIPALAKLLQHTDSEILSHTCWALSHLCDGLSTHIRAVVDADICWRLVELLAHRSWRVTKPALRTIGNIVCAEDDTDYTQHIIDAGAVPCLQHLIAHSNREIQKEACWTLSNIAAGTVEQIQTVLDSGALPSLVELASSQCLDPTDPDSCGADPEVRSEASWAVLNATSCGSDHQIEYLVQEGGIKVLGELLKQSSMVTMALEGLERILQVGDKEAYRLMVGNSGDEQQLGGSQNQEGSQIVPGVNGSGRDGSLGAGLTRGNPYAALLQATKIELLETHKNSAVAKRAQRIRKRYFVRCAICKESFSKASLKTHFCPECKCDVCRECNCTRFHLEFQEELWKEMSEQEANARASKKSKKQKKKQKAKERNKATTNGGNGGSGSSSSRGSSVLFSSSTWGAAAEATPNGTAKSSASATIIVDGAATCSPTAGGAGAANGSKSRRGNANTDGNAVGGSASGRDGGGGIGGGGGSSVCESNGNGSTHHAPNGGASSVGGGSTISNLKGKRGAVPPGRGGGDGASKRHETPGSRTVGAEEVTNRTDVIANGIRTNPRTEGTAPAVASTGVEAQAMSRQVKSGGSGGGGGGKGKGQRRARAIANDKAAVGRADESAVHDAAGTSKAAKPALANGNTPSAESAATSSAAARTATIVTASSGGGRRSNTSAPASLAVSSGRGNGKKVDQRGKNSGGGSGNSGGARVVGRSVGSEVAGGESGGEAAALPNNGISDNSRSAASAASANAAVSAASAAAASAISTAAGGTTARAASSSSSSLSFGGSSGGGKRVGGGDDDSLRQNDNYVSFLNQTGSILALARMLDRQSLDEA